MRNVFHLLQTSIEPPERLNNPLDYEPHILTLLAADAVSQHLADMDAGGLTMADALWQADGGKMFGVLVCRDNDGCLGFLAAYSGQMGGREDWPWFVPAVFDYLQPDGHFKQQEALISDINHRVRLMENDPCYVELLDDRNRIQREADAEIRAWQEVMSLSKARRDALRSGHGTSNVNSQTLDFDPTASDLIRESQFQKAELRRIKKRWTALLADAEARIKPYTEAVTALKAERKSRSDELQRWLFDQFQMLSAEGCQRSLTDIFSTTPHHVPPSGAGECCAPKLFQYAFAHHLQPLCIGEFWQGASPRMELRRHGHFYTACRGKCKPILEWMLRGIELEEKTGPEPPASAYAGTTPASSGAGNGTAADLASATGWKVYADNDIVVVNKPSGLLSVPGRTGAPSVESLLNKEYGHVYMPHRLDMDTSGLMVAARTIQAYHSLQLQFLQRTVSKTYVALVERTEWTDGSGTISLPLRPDLLDRPRQVADCEHGKPAVTHWRVLHVYGTRPQGAQPTSKQYVKDKGVTLLELTPHTGRTHQLRVHCAHPRGLDAPIVGDTLYGRPASRLFLHAAKLSFCHPATGQRMLFEALPMRNEAGCALNEK